MPFSTKDKELAYRRRRYAEKRESILQQPSRARAAAKRLGTRTYTPEQRVRMNAAARAWRKANPEKAKLADQRHHYKKNYGMSLEDRETMLEAQGGVCKVCKGKEEGWSRGWAVDHCHSTGKVRGVLCKRCNLLLGQANDNADLLFGLACYLVEAA